MSSDTAGAAEARLRVSAVVVIAILLGRGVRLRVTCGGRGRRWSRATLRRVCADRGLKEALGLRAKPLKRLLGVAGEARRELQRGRLLQALVRHPSGPGLLGA